MLQTIETIVWFAALIIGIWFMVSKKKNVPEGQPVLEPLTGKEKLLVFVLCLVNPLILGAVFYYGWKNKLPQQAKTANRLSFLAFFIFLVIWFGQGYLFIKKVGTENIKNIANNVAQVKSLDEQAKAIAARPDAEDNADIQSIQKNVVTGYDKAAAWQPDAKFYMYRRIFTIPNNSPDPIIKDADSYYYESHNTTDNYEILFDKKTNTISRIDTNPNRQPQYANNFTDISTIKIGPKKALEIAMLSPNFQEYTKSHTSYITQVILNESSQGYDLTKYWLVNVFDDFSQAHNPANSRQAFVNIQTGGLVSQEALNTLDQINNATKK